MSYKKKKQIIDAATTLFCEHGYQATGIDKVIEKAGIAKMTLYSHFKSKEELILEYLRELAKSAGVASPKQFATKIQILMEGTMAMIQLTGDHRLTKSATETLRVIHGAHQSFTS